MISVFVLISESLLAQNQDSLSYFKHKYSVALVPQYAFQNGIRLDFEHYFDERKRAVLAAPYFYSSENTRNDEELTGYGLEVQYKRYGKYVEMDYPVVYFAFGLSVRKFDIGYDVEDWVNGELDGLPVIQRGQRQVDHDIIKIGGSFLIGFQQSLFQELMLVDLYGGMGFDHSITKVNYSDPRDYNTWFGDYGYKGMSLRMGMKLGFYLDQL